MLLTARLLLLNRLLMLLRWWLLLLVLSNSSVSNDSWRNSCKMSSWLTHQQKKLFLHFFINFCFYMSYFYICFVYSYYLLLTYVIFLLLCIFFIHINNYILIYMHIYIMCVYEYAIYLFTKLKKGRWRGDKRIFWWF